MKKASRFLATTVVAVTAGVVLAGCSSSPAEPSSDNKVVIYGAYGEAQAAAFQEELDAFSAESGIDITFTSLASFDTDIKVKIEAGEAPDIALWPQPGGLLDQAEAGNLVALEDIAGLDL
jgi:alpha-glucoside transport system substrate-binding protein